MKTEEDLKMAMICIISHLSSKWNDFKYKVERSPNMIVIKEDGYQAILNFTKDKDKFHASVSSMFNSNAITTGDFEELVSFTTTEISSTLVKRSLYC